MMMNMNQKPLRKTRTFVFKKSPSVSSDVPNPTPTGHHSYSSTYVPNKAPLVEFPTSPQLIFGEEILHFNHPQHPLSKINLPDLFTCSGCKEYGSGERFVCQQCDFQLHDFCASAPSVLQAHPFHTQHLLHFYSKPVKGSGIMKSKCDVCWKPTKGYAFRCNACGFQMHPCCAMLSTEIHYSSLHPHTLRLVHGATSANAALNSIGNSSSGGFVCGECGRSRRSGKVYHCTVCDYHLHAVCAKNMINGLKQSGLKSPEKPSMIGTAARVATEAVKVFIEGLMEGIGEGVGEVLVQNVARGAKHQTTPTTARSRIQY